MRPYRVARKFGLGLFVVVTLLGGAEALVQVLDLAPGTDMFRFLVRAQDNDWEYPFMREDPQLLWSLRPGFSAPRTSEQDQAEPYLRFGVSISALGFRDREYSPQKPAGVFRILCIGDSATFGHGVPPGQTYHELLEKELRSRSRKEEGERYEVINAGVSGYSTAQGWAFLRGRGLALDPDLVIVFLGANDTKRAFWKSDQEIMEINATGLGPALRRKISNLGLYRLLRERFMRLPAEHEVKPEIKRVSAAETLKNKIGMKRTCEEGGVSVLFVLPYPQPGSGGQLPEVEFPRMDPANPGNPMTTDGVHPTPSGHQFLMQRLLAAMTERKMLPQP